jgi:hypothetical protein
MLIVPITQREFDLYALSLPCGPNFDPLVFHSAWGQRPPARAGSFFGQKRKSCRPKASSAFPSTADICPNGLGPDFRCEQGNHQRLSSLVNDQIRRCSAEHVSGIAFRTACIPETHCQRYSIKADRPNQRALYRYPQAPPTSEHPHPRNQISIARGNRRTQPHARSFTGGFRDDGRGASRIVPVGRRPKPLYEREVVKAFPHGFDRRSYPFV